MIAMNALLSLAVIAAMNAIPTVIVIVLMAIVVVIPKCLSREKHIALRCAF